MKLIRIDAPKFTAGMEIGLVVNRTSPVLKFMLGWSEAKVKAIVKKNKWRASQLTNRFSDEAIRIEKDLTEKLLSEELPEVASYTPHSYAKDKEERIGDHFCHCGKAARFGYGVRILQGIDGEWFCGLHRPELVS